MASADLPSTSEISPDLAALMQIRNLELRARVVIEGFLKGIHRSPKQGFSSEFSEYRAYAPGDDIRYIDWKVLARRNKLFIRKFKEETNLRCHLLFDLSRSMSYGSAGYTKLEYARTLAATLAVFLQSQGEKIGLLLYDDAPRDYLPPRQRKTHLNSILSALSRPAAGQSSPLSEPIKAILNRSNQRGSIFIISDFLTPIAELESPLLSLATCGYDLTLFQVLDPTEIHFNFENAVNFEDMESGNIFPINPKSARDGYLRKFHAHQTALVAICDRLGILHHLLPTDQPIKTALHHYLNDRSSQGQRIQRNRQN